MALSGTLRRTAAIAILAVSGVVASFATIAPRNERALPPQTTVLVETLALNAREVPTPSQYVQEEQFQRGDTLAGFLGRLGLDDSAIARLARAPALRAIDFGSGYYAPDGKNLRKAFLRSPLEFSRISSGFGMRLHPIQKSWRTHKGTDYAAPSGTRVRAVGDAVVEYAGIKGGYGNVVILRHNGQYSTVYAHLSRIAVRRGARVAQSETIGFVGQTGWATGPHLHYEFRIAGEPRNPLSVALRAALPLPAQQLRAFRAQADPLIARLDLR